MSNSARDFFSQACVLYDSRDGKIVHVYRNETFPGGRKKTDNEMAARATELAKRAGQDTTQLGILHVPPNGLEPGKVYKVDLGSKKLVGAPHRRKPR